MIKGIFKKEGKERGKYGSTERRQRKKDRNVQQRKERRGKER
jgi:hypothetical protein